MMRSTRILSTTLICLSLLLCAFLFSCGSKELHFDESVGKKIICKASDFENLKDDWHGKESLLSDKALSSHTEDLILGERYYFVYTFFIDYEEYKDGYYGCLGEYDISITTREWGNTQNSTSDNKNGVTIHKDEMVLGDVLRYENDWFYLNDYSKDSEKFKRDRVSFIAIPFTPECLGSLSIDSNFTIQSTFFQPLNDTLPQVTANVFDDEYAIRASANANISNFSYQIVSKEDYEDGNFDNDEVQSSNVLSDGVNYLILDYDITTDSFNGGDISCGLHLHRGGFSDLYLEQANTTKISKTENDDGVFYDFSYSLPQKDTKRIRTIFRFTASSTPCVNLDFFMYGENMRVNGTTNKSLTFNYGELSELKYRINKYGECFVTGYRNMTGRVVVPELYNGYPVIGIDDEAFKDCTKLESIHLGSVKSIGVEAFAGCTALKHIELGSSLEVISGEAFSESGITSIYIPITTKRIGYRAFHNCYYLRKLDVGGISGWKREKAPYSIEIINSVSDLYANENSALIRVEIPTD